MISSKVKPKVFRKAANEVLKKHEDSWKHYSCNQLDLAAGLTDAEVGTQKSDERTFFYRLFGQDGMEYCHRVEGRISSAWFGDFKVMENQLARALALELAAIVAEQGDL